MKHCIAAAVFLLMFSAEAGDVLGTKNCVLTGELRSKGSDKISFQMIHAFQLTRIKEGRRAVVRYTERQLKAEGQNDGAFRVTLTLGTILPGKYVLCMCTQDRYACSEPFEITLEKPNVENIALVFSTSAPRKVGVRGRILNPDTEAPVAGVEVTLCIRDSRFSPALQDLELQHGKTKADGTFESGAIPPIGVYLKSKFGNDRIALKRGDGVLGYYSIEPATEGPPDATPAILYYVPKGKGCVWYAFENDATGEPLEKGAVLQFSAARNLREEDDWNPNLKFEVTVGEKGMVRTPVVTEGEYKITALRGSSYQYTMDIEGLGSVYLRDALYAKRLQETKPDK